VIVRFVIWNSFRKMQGEIREHVEAGGDRPAARVE
jgi:hypothetical protein